MKKRLLLLCRVLKYDFTLKKVLHAMFYYSPASRFSDCIDAIRTLIGGVIEVLLVFCFLYPLKIVLSLPMRFVKAIWVVVFKAQEVENFFDELDKIEKKDGNENH